MNGNLTRLGALLTGFGTNLALNAATSVLSVVILTRSLGVEGWATIALGQAIGLVASVIICSGWPVAGPKRLHAAKESKAGVLAQSLLSRIMVLTLVWPGVLVVSNWMAPPGAGIEAVSMALASSLQGLNFVWAFVSLSRPKGLFVCDSLPRLVFGLGGAVAASASHFVWYPILLSTGALVSTYSSYLILGGAPLKKFNMPFAWQGLRNSASGLIPELVNVSLMTWPVILVALVDPQQLTQVALIDRFQKYVKTAATPVIQVMQGYAYSAGEGQMNRRLRLIGAVAMVGGILSASIIFSFGQSASAYLAGEWVDVSLGVIAAYSLIAALDWLLAASGLVALVAIGRLSSLGRTNLLGAGVLLSSVTVVAFVPHINVVLASIIFAQLIMVLGQTRAAIRGR